MPKIDIIVYAVSEALHDIERLSLHATKPARMPEPPAAVAAPRPGQAHVDLLDSSDDEPVASLRTARAPPARAPPALDDSDDDDFDLAQPAAVAAPAAAARPLAAADSDGVSEVFDDAVSNDSPDDDVVELSSDDEEKAVAAIPPLEMTHHSERLRLSSRLHGDAVRPPGECPFRDLNSCSMGMMAQT